MRRVLWLVVIAGAVGCGPKVYPQATYDEDDPRAGERDAGPGPDGTVIAIEAPRGPGERTGTMTRAELNAVLDAGPAELLKTFEVSALRPDGKFSGWQLVRFVGPHRFEAIDLAAGDVLQKLNGHTLETPQDLSALWLELYRAAAIDAVLERSGSTVTLHFEIAE